jgi:hypothetical protein
VWIEDTEEMREIVILGDSGEVLELQCDARGSVIGRDEDDFVTSLSVSAEMRRWQLLGFGHES